MSNIKLHHTDPKQGQFQSHCVSQMLMTISFHIFGKTLSVSISINQQDLFETGFMTVKHSQSYTESTLDSKAGHRGLVG